MRLLVLKVNWWRSGRKGEQGLIWHAVDEHKAMKRGPALCGVQPVRDWSVQQGDVVTCPRCLGITAGIGERLIG